MAVEPAGNVHLASDDGGIVQHLEHVHKPFTSGSARALAAGMDATLAFPPSALSLAEEYLREFAPVYGIEERMLPGPGPGDGAGVSTALAGEESSAGKLVLGEEKDLMGTTTVSYQQTYNDLPVWEAGFSITVLPEPLRVTASQSSVHRELSFPSTDTSEGVPAYAPETVTGQTLQHLLGNPANGTPTLNGTRRLIYRYDPDQRRDPEALAPDREPLEEGPPTLPLPAVPDSVRAGGHYTVVEALFTLPVPGQGSVHWRAFIEEHTGAVLYLRAFTACAIGMVFRTDPSTAAGSTAPGPTAGAVLLDRFRARVDLEGLSRGNPQELSGQFVRLTESGAPVFAAPTQANPPGHFFYSAPSREFAAVNAYHHCDWLFRHMQGMGFDVARYFDGTEFPVPVDACAENDRVNARAPGNAFGTGSDGFRFGLAGSPFPVVSIAADLRVVLHEFGHALLWDSVHSPNFGFAHSAGDSLAAILLDPESALRDDPVRRFETFPWLLPDRNHGRDVAAGWGWGGSNDAGGYASEQILSTTLFRLYRALGGDAEEVGRRKHAARLAVYLVYRAIGTLASNPVTLTPNPGVFATALMNADVGTRDFEGHRGGAVHKVVRWSFEKQGLYQLPSAPRPVRQPGAPPQVDVYIDDGRGGEYRFQRVYWECRDIWNRLEASPDGGEGVHQEPLAGQTNFAYVRVRNRGTAHAGGVVVRGYTSGGGVGLSWPDDWMPTDTGALPVAGGIAPGAVVLVGPFRWTPRSTGPRAILMEVSADQDPSNIDGRTSFPCARGPTPDWMLVPFDNNLAIRAMTAVPGAGDARGLLSAFVDERIRVQNPTDRVVHAEVRAELPEFLAERGWCVRLDHREGATAFRLPAGGSREVIVSLRPGSAFSAEDVSWSGGGAAIRIAAHADGILMGGFTYTLAPEVKWAPPARKGDLPVPPDHPSIVEALQDTGVAGTGSGVTLFAAEHGAPAAPDTGAQGPSDSASAAERILSHLGFSTGSAGGGERVRLRRVSVDIDFDPA